MAHVTKSISSRIIFFIEFPKIFLSLVFLTLFKLNLPEEKKKFTSTTSCNHIWSTQIHTIPSCFTLRYAHQGILYFGCRGEIKVSHIKNVWLKRGYYAHLSCIIITITAGYHNVSYKYVSAVSWQKSFLHHLHTEPV